MKRRQRGSDWYRVGVGERLVRVEKPGLVDWSTENRVRAVAAVIMVVLLVVISVHALFAGWDRQIAIDDERNRQQWSDFYAAQEG